MIIRDLNRLRGLQAQARQMGQSLVNTGAFQHPRISLPIGEAQRHLALAESFLADAADTAEAELYRGSK